MFVDIHRILFPTDFSEPARQAQKYAMALAERFGAELHLLHVIPPMLPTVPDSTGSWVSPDADHLYMVGLAKTKFIQELDPAWTLEHQTETTVVVGFAVDEIVKYAEQHKIDLLVIGSHGYSGLSHLMFGSVAEKVVRLAGCPVMTIHSKGHHFLTDAENRPSAGAPSM